MNRFTSLLSSMLSPHTNRMNNNNNSNNHSSSIGSRAANSSTKSHNNNNDIDDEDDDIEQIKSKILKTLSKIEQAEVD